MKTVILEELKQLNILHVESEEIIRNNVTNCFGHIFNDIIGAQNKKEALKLFNDHQVDIVIIDMFLHNVSTIDTLLHMRQISPMTPYIVTLTDTSHNNIIELIALNVNHILAKPYDLKCLYNKIIQISQSQQQKQMNTIYAQHELQQVVC
jgi:DNA-binding NtrC family response regulator